MIGAGGALTPAAKAALLLRQGRCADAVWTGLHRLPRRQGDIPAAFGAALSAQWIVGGDGSAGSMVIGHGTGKRNCRMRSPRILIAPGRIRAGRGGSQYHPRVASAQLLRVDGQGSPPQCGDRDPGPSPPRSGHGRAAGMGLSGGPALAANMTTVRASAAAARRPPHPEPFLQSGLRQAPCGQGSCQPRGGARQIGTGLCREAIGLS